MYQQVSSAASVHDGESPIGRPRRSQRGASAVEYGLLITGITALIVLIVFAFGDNVHDLFSDTCDGMAAQGAGSNC